MNDEYIKHVNMSVTSEIEEFVNEEVFGGFEYLFIPKADLGNTGYCSKCKHEYPVENLKHNETIKCPVCGAFITTKLSRYGRKNCRNEACFYYFEKSLIDTNVIVCKGYYVTKDYTLDYRNPVMDYSLCAIYIFQNKEATMLQHSWWYSRWEKRCSIYDFNQGWLAPKMCYCSFESLERAIQGTSFQYIPYKIFMQHYSMVKFLDECAKHPWIEQICKIGFDDIIKEKLSGGYIYNCLNYKGKNIFKILKISRKDLKDIKNSRINITPLFLSIYQMQVKDHSGFSPYEVEQIKHDYGYNHASLKNVMKYTTMKKAIRYLEKQYEKNKEKLSSRTYTLTTWSDYINDCIKLELSLKDDSILYPKNVYNAHQNTIKQVKVRESEILNNKITNRLKALEKYCFEFNGLFIRPAENSKELIDEGKTLSHCVGTYAERYAKGETNIFFIRKASEPDKPFFTMEVRKDEIIQTRGLKNCDPDDLVEKFIEAFKNAKLNKNKTKVKIPA